MFAAVSPRPLSPAQIAQQRRRRLFHTRKFCASSARMSAQRNGGACTAGEPETAGKKLRVLCLHGMGTSSVILKRQLRALLELSSSDVDFVFLDGQEECPPADSAIARVFPDGPYYRYMERIKDAIPPVQICEGVMSGDLYGGIEAAIAHVRRCVAEQGPFDGFLGFSQGANLSAIAAADLLLRQPPEAEALRFVVLFNGTQWASQVPELLGPSRLPLRLHSFHVLGREDPFLPTTRVLRDLFLDGDGAVRESHEHPSGHRPMPPAPEDARACAAAVRGFLEGQIARKEKGEPPLWRAREQQAAGAAAGGGRGALQQ